MGADEETVGVIVPMYNAERTIAATMASICAQTHRRLDVVVTDDGSTDGSATIVEGGAGAMRACASSARATPASPPRAMPARRRPAAQFLAFVDADDIWAPTKIEYQLAALSDGGPSVGLAYCWFASIDQRDRVEAGERPIKPSHSRNHAKERVVTADIGLFEAIYTARSLRHLSPTRCRRS